MNLTELRQEVEDRGYDYMKPSRIELFIQRAYQQICSRYPWPFLETETTVKTPAEIANLGHILSVTDTATEFVLRGVSPQYILTYYINNEAGGTPFYWYLKNKQLNVFPASEDSIRVTYIMVAPTLSEADEPLMPVEWQYLIVDQAVAYCLKDNNESPLEQRNEVDEGITEMVHALMHPDYQRDNFIFRSGSPRDYL